jgi:excisionase family DNA binding protein
MTRGEHGTVSVEDDYRHETVWLKSGEVAELLHVSVKTVSRYAKEGKIPYMRTVGGHRRYPRQGIRDSAKLWQDDND